MHEIAFGRMFHIDQNTECYDTFGIYSQCIQQACCDDDCDDDDADDDDDDDDDDDGDNYYDDDVDCDDYSLLLLSL